MIIKIKKIIMALKLSKERELDYLKLEKILVILNNHVYFDSPTSRNYYNLIHEVATVINENYDICEDFGKVYIDDNWEVIKWKC